MDGRREWPAGVGVATLWRGFVAGGGPIEPLGVAAPALGGPFTRIDLPSVDTRGVTTGLVVLDFESVLPSERRDEGREGVAVALALVNGTEESRR